MTTHQDVPKLSQDESQSLEGTLSEQETLMFLKKKMKNDKSPGPDGFTK